MQNQTTQEQKPVACGCGRSPTGICIGWHNLTEDQYWDALNEYNYRSIPTRMPGIDERYG